LNAFDLEIASEDPADIIRVCQLLEPTVGGINLEDIRAPDCFVIEAALRETLAIPVFHDDQHGTAIISGAALVNALELIGKQVADVRIVFSGAGAAAVATAAHFERLGVGRAPIVLCDRLGVVYQGRVDDMEPHKARFASQTGACNIGDALDGADVLAGLSVGRIITGAMISRMAKRPIVFALANPVPEILPDEVLAARPDAIVATGRSDFPNQVNNVLGFPYIFRGALDVGASSITEPMILAATHALAALAKESVSNTVSLHYGRVGVRFGPEYLIPFIFDPRLLPRVASAVAEAAVRGGVATRPLDRAAYEAALTTSVAGRPGRATTNEARESTNG